MNYLTVDEDGTEKIHPESYKPIRGYYTEYLGKWVGLGIIMTKGSIEKLIGKKLTWKDDPFEYK